MKIAFLAIALAAATSAQAGDLLPSHGSGATFASGKSAASSLSFEAAGRKGSKRVGGSGKSGKGGHYVGGPQVGLTKFCTGPLRRASLSLGPALRQKLITYVRLQSSSDLGIAFRQLRLAAMLLSPVRQWWVLAVAKAEGDVASP